MNESGEKKKTVNEIVKSNESWKRIKRKKT